MINGRGLRSDSKRSHLLFFTFSSAELISVVLKDTHFDYNFHEVILLRDYLSFWAYFDGHSRGVTWLINRRLISMCTLVLSDPASRLCILDVTTKDKAFRLLWLYGSDAVRELPTLFRRIEPYMTSSRRVILVSHWNVVLDPN